MPINETLIELYGTHEASFNELINKVNFKDAVLEAVPQISSLVW